jgi:hypothetical protein
LDDAVEIAIEHFVGDKYGSNGLGSFVFEVNTARTASWRTQGIVYEASRFCEFNIFATDDLYTEDRRDWVAELAARMTDNVPAGAFIFRYDEGDVRFRVVRTFRDDEPITPAAIIHTLEQVAFPLRLWERAFAYRYDTAVAPQMALEASLVAEDAYEGAGLSKAASKAIMGAQVASGLVPIPVVERQPPVPSPFLKLHSSAAIESQSSSSSATEEQSTFSRLMNTPVAQKVRKPDEQVAAVVVFSPEITEQDANELLYLISDYCESTDVQEFEPRFGGPVLYFP